MRFSLTGVAICAVLLAGCGSSSDNEKAADSPTSQAPKPKPEVACNPLPRPALENLEASLTRGGKLSAPRYVPSKEKGDLPGLQREGLFIIAADSGDRRLVWAASGGFVKTGGGLAVGLEENTRTVSELGADLPLDSAGVSMSTDGVTEALSCRP